ncbi:MAG: UbiH/UbiF/VisC/COQ6 family ubiquinone biosynthesis hydroxylase [Marinobacter sp.]|uniref:UbiH/UbiF/VisC/COQ6 family ubiquinone biosynthesis hydroxylase n=1 Tax=Marinobacter sp. TaxID=50741 RepID=UPI0029C3FD40|nr:UbiH/UbiF/VisC/COQ6 family ubiquinone biosynthesis hydroxylase [Marinobacter sp.]MDX5387478.1 UbiH/UbiF/VisC/COQ6 family ubiquinone biosynthesis hydroxylase [Marinobacter sp.]
MTSDSGNQPMDILIVGGGMIGSALALGLCRQGWQVGLIEGATAAELVAPAAPATDVSDFEPRVSAISLASQRLLDELGAWRRVQDSRHCGYRQMTVWDGDGTGRIHFDAAELHASSLGTIVENRNIVRALFEELAASDVTLFDGVRVKTWHGRDGVELEDGRRLNARLVVGADGALSRLRQWSGLATREWDYDQQAIVCTVRTRQSHRYTAWQRFSPTGPLAFLPLLNEAGDDHFCSIVWSQDTLEAKRLMALDTEAFRQALGVAIEQQLGEVLEVSGRFAFPLRQRHAKDYVTDGLALVGDAAHTIHPLAGQGANLGYGDVRALLEELARAKARNLAPDDALVLARYQRRRKGENLTMMAAMEGFKQLFARDDLPVRWLRNTGMRWFEMLAPLKKQIAARAMGVTD